MPRELKNIHWKYDARYQVAPDAYQFAVQDWIMDDRLECL